MPLRFEGAHAAALRWMYWLTLTSVTAVTFSVAISSITMGAAIVLLLALVITRGPDELPRTPLDAFILLYLAAEVLATLFSGERWDSFVNMKRFFLVSFLYLILLSVRSRDDLLRLVAIPVAVGALLSVIEAFSLTSAGGHIARLSLFQYFLTEGGIKLILLLLALPVAVQAAAPRRWRIGALVAFVPLFLGLILTQSRSAWLGFVAGVCTIGAVQEKRLLLLLVILLVCFVLFAPSDFRARAASIFDPSMSSNLSRIHMITTGWRMFLDHPLAGVGDIDLKRLYVTYTVPIEEGEGGHLHNNMMMLLVTLGLPGAIACAALFAKMFVVELGSSKAAQADPLLGSIATGCLAGFVGFQVNGLFEWNFGDHEIAVLFWFTAGVAILSNTLAGGTRT